MEKDRMTLIGQAIGLTICALLIGVCIYTCHHTNRNTYTDKTPTVVDQDTTTQDLGFIDASSVVAYQDLCAQRRAADDLFLSIDHMILYKIAQVLIKKNGSVTIDEILEEYSTNNYVYETLSDDGPATISTDTLIINDKPYIHYEGNNNNVRRD